MPQLVYYRHDLSGMDLFSKLNDNHGAGVSLRYDPILDQIKEARREDNDRISHGIWQTEFKKSDWPEVERLCTQALATLSKDVQILGWLMESWISMEGVAGCRKGFDILNAFCTTYWQHFYPVMEHDTFEARITIFDWIDKILQERVLFLELTNGAMSIDGRALTLADWMETLNFEKALKRTTDTRGMMKDVEAQRKVTLAQFKKCLSETPRAFLQSIYDAVDETLKTIHIFCKQSEVLFKQKVALFMGVEDHLKTILRIMQLGLEQTKPTLKLVIPEQKELEIDTNTLIADEFSDASTQSNSTLAGLLQTDSVHAQVEAAQLSTDETISLQRQQAYQAIRDLSGFLQEIEPHSPTHAMLEILGTWESKNLIQIMKECTAAELDGYQLLKMLAGLPQNR